MALANRISQTAQSTILLAVPDKLEEAVLDRIAAVAQTLSAELHIFFPIVIPPVPLTSMASEMPPLVDDHRMATARTRRLAADTLRALRSLEMRATAQVGVCASVNEGVLNAASRLQPDLLMVPRSDNAGIFDRPFVPDCEEIATHDVATWVISRSRVASESILGLLEPGSRNDTDNERVARETARLARSLNAQAHLLCCDSKRESLELAEAAIAQQITKVAEHEESETVREIYELASRHQIPNTRIHIDNANEADVIERILEPLGVGLVVACSRSRSILGGLFKREKIPDVPNAACDLLVLGEADVPHS
ncbi:MAG TPA: universal stress protein [Gammaproteobacteria bacterium]|nr:universal stress protein [Gammaproteobacteria bacterium]